jgi:hypothetical protein
MAQQVNKSGKISLLLTQAIGSGWGPANDFLDAEAIVRLQGVNESFGMQLRAGDNNLSANLSMLALLRDAHVHGYTVALVGWFEPGKTNGRLARVSLTGPQPTPLETEAIGVLHRDFAEVAGFHQ